MFGFCGSIARGAERRNADPDCKARHVAPASVLLNIASALDAYNVSEFCGSTTSESLPSGSGITTLQVSAPSVLLNNPAPVTAYTVFGFRGSTTKDPGKDPAPPPSGPRLAHTLTPAWIA